MFAKRVLHPTGQPDELARIASGRAARKGGISSAVYRAPLAASALCGNFSAASFLCRPLAAFLSRRQADFAASGNTARHARSAGSSNGGRSCLRVS